MKFTVEKDEAKYTYTVFTITISEDDSDSPNRLEFKIKDLNEDEVQDLVDQINEATGVDLG